MIEGKRATIGADFATERLLLSPLPSSHYEVGVPINPKVDAKSRVWVRQCKYSVPVKLIGRRVDVTLRADEVIISHSGRVVAHHERLVHRLDESLHLDHYLEILLRKPGALAASSPLAQARAAGVFTPAHDAYWEEARRQCCGSPKFPTVDHRNSPGVERRGGLDMSLRNCQVGTSFWASSGTASVSVTDGQHRPAIKVR
ncbi:IstA2 [mine drainage metagenome]|uniref:IstA2 n=1 Tax=mine drainage metagenome TaxID=410659 RepID=T0ZAG2_9ZZZZ